MKYVCSWVLLASFTGAAAATDFDGSLRGTYDWSGVHVGATVGYGGGATGNSWTNTMFYPAWQPDGEMRYRSWLGGAHAGVMHQSGQLVLGLEGDYNFVRFRGDDARFAGEINAIEIDGYATARARLGWANDRSLFYATGGVAYAEIAKKDLSLTFSTTRAKAVGWVAGVGYEHAIRDNWLARVEYQHVDLGKAETYLQSGIGGYSHRADGIRFDTVRVGVGYKF